MTLIKDEEYLGSRNIWINYFKDNYKQDKEGSRPTDYIYIANQIPNSYFTAIDVYSQNNQFLSRYLIIVVRNGDTSKNTPQSFDHYIDEDLADLKSPVGIAMFSKGIAVLFVDDDHFFKDIVIEHNLRMSSN